MNILNTIWDWIYAFFIRYVVKPIMVMDVRDIVDVLLLAVILFEVYRFARTRRAGRVLVGLLIVVFCSALMVSFQLPSLAYIVRLLAAAAFFCIIVIFQPEIRDMLEHLGNVTLFNPRSNTISRKKLELAHAVANETVDAVAKMAESKTGALIVFEGLTKLGDYISTGQVVDARVTSKLLQNIFYDNAPLHDGALIIRDLRIWAASCVLPSTRSKMDFGTMGTRHRAAVGVTEVSDALVIVISEQTGVVSVAQDGKLLRDVDSNTLKDILMTYIAGNAYLRIKRANMRKEYLEMLEKVASAKPTVVANTQEDAVEKEFNKLFAQSKEDNDTEPDYAMEDKGAESVSSAKKPSDNQKS